MTLHGHAQYLGLDGRPLPGAALAGEAPVHELPRLVVAAPSSGQGASTLTLGLMAALTARGLAVSPHKVGPDDGDAGRHALACGRRGRNLDPWLVGEHRIAPLFLHGARTPTVADIAVVEGTMGLHDGRVGNGWFGSTAHIAALIDAPVVLVLDVSVQARSAAAVVLGMRSFDPRIRVVGVLLNRAGSERHSRLLRQAMSEVDVPVLGAFGRDAALARSVSNAAEGVDCLVQDMALIRQLGDAVATSVDLEALLGLARSAPPLRTTMWDPVAELAATPSGALVARAATAGWTPSATVPVPGPARWASPAEAVAQARAERDLRPVVAVASGPAFSFSYAENAALLEAAGAKVVEFDPLRAPGLPDRTRAVVLGGGHPEAHAEALSANRVLLSDLWSFDGPIVAEAAGLAYLGQRLDGKPMVGRLPVMSVTTPQPTTAHREAKAPADSVLAERGATVRGHESHRTRTEPLHGDVPAWEFDVGGMEGFVQGWVHAAPLRLNWGGHPWIASRLVEATLARL